VLSWSYFCVPVIVVIFVVKVAPVDGSLELLMKADDTLICLYFDIKHHSESTQIIRAHIKDPAYIQK